MNISIRYRIYFSFLLFVCLFVLNVIITIITLDSNKKLATHLFKVVNPSIQGFNDFKRILIESKMYTTNWVFLRHNQEDKAQLETLHDSGYKIIKARLTLNASLWQSQTWADSLNRLLSGFEQLLVIEKEIMVSLKEFKNYDDPVIKLEAERKLEEEILPRTAALMKSLNSIHAFGENIRTKELIQLEQTAMKLRRFIIILTILIICAGVFFSIYMTRVIISPVNKIRQIINNLARGIIQKIDHQASRNEIGKMVLSVNILSEKLQAAATFAYETGLRNFDAPFNPLSDQDTLGKALITMRDSIKLSHEELNNAQHLAHIGSWERNIKTGKLTLSDEAFNIFDIDPLLFDFTLKSILQLIHPEDIETALDIARKNLYKVPVPFECRIITAKGIEKNVVVETKVILGKYGEVEKAFGVIQDITERKKSEEQLKLSNERYELVTKTTNDMIWDWNLVNNTIFRNENYDKIFGAGAGDRNDIGKWITLVHPDDKGWVADFIQKKIDDPEAESFEVEFRYYRYNGEMAYLYDRGYIIRDENKKAIRMVGATSDVTERKKAELGLYKSEERYRQIVETAQEGIWLIDENSYISFFNKKMCEILGYSAAEMKGKKLFDFMDEEGRKNALQQIEKRKQKINGNYDVKYITKSGMPIWTNISTNSIFDEEGKYQGALAMVTDITERKKTEQSNLLKAELLNTVGQAVIATDIKGFINFWNRAAEKIYGWTTEEAIGKNIINLTPSQRTREQAIEIMHELSQGRSWSGEFIVRGKNGKVFPAFVTDSPIYDQDHNLSGIIGVSSNITERKKTEEALSNNELRFRTLTGSAPVGIFQTNIEGKTIYVNETWLEYTGMTFEETMGTGWVAAVHPDDRKVMVNDWNDRSEKGIESSTEYRLIDKKGKTRWVMGKAVPIFNSNGEIFGHIGTVSDITERKKAIESLEQSENKYRQIVETAQEGIWLIDENDYTTFINDKMCEIIEYSRQELMGEKIYHFMDDESKKNAFEQIERRKQGISEIHDSVFITKSGKHVWVNISTNPVLDEKGKYKGALAMMTDITGRKLDEELLHQSELNLALNNKELEEKNKELEQFAYVASHDLQEPLRTTSTFVELFQQQYKGKLDEKADKYLAYIVQASDRMKTLITDLLDYSRIGSKLELKQVDCTVMLNEVIDDLGAAIAETGAEIRSGELPVISGYPTEIKQLFQNLIINSIKFRKKDIPPRITVSVKKKDGYWQFAFADNGIGINKQHHERIFVIFQRLHTRNEYAGSGIGLSHCKKIVELHKGKIWLESEPGKGTTFYFTIPIKKQKQ